LGKSALDERRVVVSTIHRLISEGGVVFYIDEEELADLALKVYWCDECLAYHFIDEVPQSNKEVQSA